MIELAAKKAPPFGNIVRDFAMRMPQYRIEVNQGDTKQNSVQVDVMGTMVNGEVVGRVKISLHTEFQLPRLPGSRNASFRLNPIFIFFWFFSFFFIFFR